MTGDSVVPTVAVPSSVEEADQLLAELGGIMRSISTAKTREEARIAQVKAATAKVVDPLTARRAAIVEALATFATQNRTELTEGGTLKTVVLRHGTLKWRLSPESLSVTGKVADIIAALKRRRGGKACIRVKEELDKDALKKNPALIGRIDGLQLERHEDFVVAPSNSQTEVVREGHPFRVRRALTS